MLVLRIFAVIFGRGSLARSLTWTLGLLAASLLLSQQLAGITQGLAASLRPDILLYGTVFVSQILAVLSFVSAYGLTSSQNSLLRILHTLPLPTWQMWICRELPNLVLAVVITPLIVLPLWPLFEVANIWPGLCVLGGLAGISSAIGLVFGVPRRYRRFTPLLIAVVWWSEYKIILLMQTPHPQIAGWTLLLITGVLCALGIVQALRASPMPTSSSKQVTTSSVPLPYFFKKLLRARAAQHGFVTSLLLGGGLVFICNKTRINDSAVIALALTLLTSLYVVDVRALCRRLRPAEITTLRGTMHFVWNELSATAIATLLALSPLLWLAGRQNIASTLSAIALGLGIGLLVSTLLVPEQRNISSQVMATFLCIGINIAVSRLEPMRQLSSLSLYGIYLMAFLGFLLIAAMTEYQRNRFVWRSYDSPSNKT